MKNYDNLHRFQMLILNKLIFLTEARFRDLAISGLSTDHQSYHLKELLKAGLVKQNLKGKYNLTDDGKEFIGRIDTDTANIEKQGKRGVVVRVTRSNKMKTQYLVNRRIKQPFYDYVGFYTGKIRLGESIFVAAARELKEEAGLQAQSLILTNISHYIDYRPSGELIQDIYLYGMNAAGISGELIENNPQAGVKSFWITLDQFKKEKTFPNFWKTSKYWITEQKASIKIPFIEETRIIPDY